MFVTRQRRQRMDRFLLLLLLLVARSLSQKSGAHKGDTRQPRRLQLSNYEAIGGYIPTSNAYDANALDLDQELLEQVLSNPTAASLDTADMVYREGGHAYSMANLVVTTINATVDPRVSLTGQTAAGTQVKGLAYDGYFGLLGDTNLLFWYHNVNRTTQQVPTSCQIGGLPDANIETNGCLMSAGTLTVDGTGTTIGYSMYNELANTRNELSLFELGASASLMCQANDCPYYLGLFVDYYGISNYANAFLQAALTSGVTTGFVNGANDFSKRSTEGVLLRSEVFQRGTVVLNVWMGVLTRLHMAVTQCESVCPACNMEAAAVWDEAVAYYTGSLVGDFVLDSDALRGNMLLTLANEQCRNFKTCGPNRDGLSGNSFVNIHVVDLFQMGQREVLVGNCTKALLTTLKIGERMTVPLLQATLQAAYSIEAMGTSFGAGAVHAASVLPLVHACSPQDARSIYDQLQVDADNSTSYTAIKATLERHYDCMGLTCADMGGYYDPATQDYFAGAQPCPGGFPSIAGYQPNTQTNNYAAIDLDQRAFGELLELKTAESFGAAIRVYRQGGFSGSYAVLTLMQPLVLGLSENIRLEGLGANGGLVRGRTLETATVGSVEVSFRYDRGGCSVGGLPPSRSVTKNCLAPVGVLDTSTAGAFAYTNATNLNTRNLAQFSKNAAALMLNCSSGCPHQDFLKFYQYYGVADYGDQWITAAIAGSPTSFTAAHNTDFSSASLDLRVEAAKIGSAFMNVWMYVIHEFEDAVNGCTEGMDRAHSWDNGVAFYTGSLVGQARDSVEVGTLVYTLANERCVEFRTCGAENNQVSGNSHVNRRLFDLFREGRDNLSNGKCNAARVVKNKIASLMAVPLVQSTLFYAYTIVVENNASQFVLGKGAAFAAAVVPIVFDCSESDATIIHDNMRVGSTGVDFAAVKAAFERNYECIGIKCHEVGGVYDSGTYSSGFDPCEDGLERIAGYLPSTKVTDHTAIDLDQRALGLVLAKNTAQGLSEGRDIYERGGYSKSIATVMLNNPLPIDIGKGATVQGLDETGGIVEGEAFMETARGEEILEVQYNTARDQSNYLDCQVGGLPPSFRNLDGCLANNGTIVLGGTGAVQYQYNAMVANTNFRTIQKFSLLATLRMLECPIGCPYVDFIKFNDYYAIPEYGDKWVSAALDGTPTNFPNFNVNFETGIGSTLALRSEAAKLAALNLNTWMYTIREFEDGIDDCTIGCLTCNDDPVNAWDEAVGFYAGSLVGTEPNSLLEGVVMYSQANDMCTDFRTCGPNNNSTMGNAHINMRLFELFEEGLALMLEAKCEAARIVKTKIVSLMTIPLIQGTLGAAYEMDVNGDTTPQVLARGAIYAASIIPMINACSPQDAGIIAFHMDLSNPNADFLAVKTAFERNYDCLKIKCSDIGGYYDASAGDYLPDAAPCLNSFEPIAGFIPASQVTDQAAIDLDQKSFETELITSDVRGRRVYQEGGNSKSFARLSLFSPVVAPLLAGTVVDGLTADGELVEGKLLSDFVNGSMVIDVQYATYNEQAQYVSCRVGGLFQPQYDGCFRQNGTILVEGYGYVDYIYDPLSENLNGRTLQGFSTNANTTMRSCNGACFYPDFAKFFNYYGVTDYANQWVMAALTRTGTNFANGNANFSTGIGARRGLRVEAAQKGSAYMNVWMYVIRQLEVALDACTQNCFGCNDDAVHAWDAAVAFYAGSSVGPVPGSIEESYLIYSLANKRCQNFRTCGPNKNAITGSANINIRILDLFKSGQSEVLGGMCTEARQTKVEIAKLMAVPLIQGTLRYAYILSLERQRTPKNLGEGAAFAAAVLPIVNDCDPIDALAIYDFMRVGAEKTNFALVKRAFENVYDCMGIQCSDVGGYFDKDNGLYFGRAEPCADASPRPTRQPTPFPTFQTFPPTPRPTISSAGYNKTNLWLLLIAASSMFWI